MSDGDKDGRRIGRDEMNLAEFPITLLTDQPSKEIKTLVFEGRNGKLTITGSDDYGLPIAPDADVIVGLIQLTKIKNDFTSPTVTFTRYELINLLGWPDKGRYYRRLDESLKRWVGVTLRYDECWWDNDIKCKVDANFHIIDSVTIFDRQVRNRLRARQQPLPLSSFAWGNAFFRSCKAGNLKMLDLETYFGLRSAVSKQLYRFLDKRFYRGAEWVFDLRELAFEHVGLSRNYTAAKIKEKLKPAIEELEGLGFLEPMTITQRYANVRRGEWRIRLVRKSTTPAEVKPESPAPAAGLVKELIDRGITPAAATKLVGTYPAERITAKIEVYDWLLGKKDKSLKTNPAGFLVKSIEDDYAVKPGFVSKAEKDRCQEAERERQRQETEARMAKLREQEADAKVEAYWASLSPDQRSRIEAEALASADPATRENYDTAPLPALKRVQLKFIREGYIKTLLGLSNAG